MKKLFLILAVVAMVGLYSCSDSTSPETINLSLVSSISTSKISSNTNPKDISIQSVSELNINSIRILLSNIKVKVGDLEKQVKLGPSVFSINEGVKGWEFAKTNVPVGKLDKVKFEIHRFPTSELATYANDPVLMDFATPERHTIIITGKKNDNGQVSDFVYKSDVVVNLSYDFNPAIVIPDSGYTTIEFPFHPEFVFKNKNGVLLDPTDPKNRNDIDNQLKSAIKALKKL